MEQGELALSDREFERIKQRVYRVAGISLSDAKRTLVVSRLLKLVKALNLPSFDAYVDFLERSRGCRMLPIPTARLAASTTKPPTPTTGYLGRLEAWEVR